MAAKPPFKLGVVGHFGLAVQDYTHSTAPNRRFSDLVTQRLLKAAVTGGPSPYTEEELAEIFGRPVDLLSRKAVERSRNPFRRRSILESARVIYDAA